MPRTTNLGGAIIAYAVISLSFNLANFSAPGIMTSCLLMGIVMAELSKQRPTAATAWDTTGAVTVLQALAGTIFALFFNQSPWPAAAGSATAAFILMAIWTKPITEAGRTHPSH